MEDIHTPSIAHADAPASTEVPTDTAGLLALMAEKDTLELELKALGAVLDSVRPARARARTPHAARRPLTARSTKST